MIMIIIKASVVGSDTVATSSLKATSPADNNTPPGSGEVILKRIYAAVVRANEKTSTPNATFVPVGVELTLPKFTALENAAFSSANSSKFPI
jgi:hypothetical protein